jgi:3-(3-hydroxy-phenyl)propionate hydroxylase
VTVTGQAAVGRREVIVVGAGPVGMSAALALASLGHTPMLLEAGAQDRARPGSRAIFVHKESIYILDRLMPGLGRELIDNGLTWPTKRTLYRGKTVFSRTYPLRDPAKVPQFTSLPQLRTEALLLDACKRASVEIVFNAAVTEVSASADGVTLQTADGGSWSAQYVVAADGAASAVRQGVGITMEGSRSDGWYIVVDVEEDEDDPLPVARTFHYQDPAIGGRNVLLVPFAGCWRVDLQLHETDDQEQFGSAEGVRGWLPKVLAPKYADRIIWVSSYQFLQVLAREFVDPARRVLLAGEAAHLFAPFGARGMNSGIADAEAAATAIHVALAATNPERAAAAVTSYGAARQAAAEFNRASAGSALTHLRPDRRAALRQRLAAGLSGPVPRLGEWLERAPYGSNAAPPGATSGRY